MKLLKTLYRQKQVEYFGLKLMMPEDHNCLATDSDGRVYSSVEKPKQRLGMWVAGTDTALVARVNLEGMDWKDTLRRYK